MNRENVNIPCNRLVLSGCGITDIGVAEISHMLKNAQRSPGQAMIHEIDLTRNRITDKGIEIIGKALTNNFTLTTLKLDTENIEDPRKLDLIYRELIVNSYMQGVDHQIDQAIVNRLFPRGERDIQKLLEKKLKHNPRVIDFPTSNRPEVRKLLARTQKTNRLHIIVEDRPTKPAEKAQKTFKEFLDVYRTLHEDEAVHAFKAVDRKKFTALVRNDIYDKKAKKTTFNQLRQSNLSEEHKRNLFEFCFEPEDPEGYKEKAILVANMLGNEESAKFFLEATTTAKFRDAYLTYAVSQPSATGETVEEAVGEFAKEYVGEYVGGAVGKAAGTVGDGVGFVKDLIINPRARTFDEIKLALETARKNALAAGDRKSAAILDRPLQMVIQANLVKRFECLQKPQCNESDFKKLTAELERNFELRYFKPNGINTNVENYIKGVVIRNQLHDALSRYPTPSTKLANFARIISNFPPQERENILKDFMASNSKMLIDVVKKDIANYCPALGNISTSIRIEIIEKCMIKQTSLVKSITDAEIFGNIHKTAMLMSNLIFRNPRLLNEQIQKIFDQPTTAKNSFENRVKELKKLNDSTINMAIRDTQRDVIMKKILQDPRKNHTSWLKQQLRGNFDLEDIHRFGFDKYNIHPDDQETIELYCRRNQLIKLVTERPKNIETAIKNFKDIYKKMSKDKRSEIFAENEKILIFGRILLDKDADVLADPKMKKFIEKMFLHLHNDRSVKTFRDLETFKKMIEEKITSIEKDLDVDVEKTKSMTNILYQTLHPDYDPNRLKMHQLEKLATKSPNIDIDLFISIHNDIRGSKFFADERVAILSRILDEYPDLDDPKMKKIVEDAFRHLNDQDPKMFREKLEKKIQDIGKDASDDINIYHTRSWAIMAKKTIMNILTKALHPNLSKDELKIYQFKKVAKSPESNSTIFLDLYKEIPLEKLDDLLKNTDKATILQIVSKDLGENDSSVTCTKLRQLPEKHRIKILEHCFGSDPKQTKGDTYKKAILISELLKIKELFPIRGEVDKTVQNIKYQIYWAISPKGSTLKMGYRTGLPYYYADETIKNLKSIISKVKPPGDLTSKIKEIILRAESAQKPKPKKGVTRRPPILKKTPEASTAKIKKKINT